MGDQLGYYRAMAEHAPHARPSSRRTPTADRYVREWLNAQAAGGFVATTATGSYTLPAEHAVVLTDREPGLPGRVLPDAPAPCWTAADRRGGPQRRRHRLARAQPRRPLGCERFFGPATRAPRRRLASGPRRRRREARARRQRRRHRLRPRRLDDPHGAGVPGVDVRRLRLPRRSIETARARAPGRGRRRSGAFRGGGRGAASPAAATTSSPSSTASTTWATRWARPGTSGRRSPTTAPGWSSSRRAGDRIEDNLNPVGRVVLRLLHAALHARVAVAGRSGGARRAGRPGPIREVIAEAGFTASAAPPRRRSTWCSRRAPETTTGTSRAEQAPWRHAR